MVQGVNEAHLSAPASKSRCESSVSHIKTVVSDEKSRHSGGNFVFTRHYEFIPGVSNLTFLII